MWMFASAQSTNSPSIQIFFVGVIGTGAPDVRGGRLPWSMTPAPHRRPVLVTRPSGSRWRRSAAGARRQGVPDFDGTPGSARTRATRHQVDRHRRLHPGRGRGQAHVGEQHGHREHGRGRVGDPLAGDVRRAAVHRLEHRRVSPGDVDVAAGRQPDAARDRGAKVGEDVPEQVVGHHHVEAPRLGYEVHRRGVGVGVGDGHRRELRPDRVDGARPQVTGPGQHVGLVHEGEVSARSTIGPGEGVADDALHAVPGVQALFGRDLVRGAATEHAAGTGVRALGALPNDDHVDVVRADPGVPSGVLERGLLLRLRFALDHHVNLRPVRLYPGVATPLAGVGPDDIDMVVVREGTEGPYAGAGGVLRRGTAHEVATEESLNTRYGVERVVRDAFARADSRPRRHLTLVHKTNVLTRAGDLWARTVDAVRAEFPAVTVAYTHVDAAAMYFVTQPRRFDVVVTDNLFGDILTDLGAAIAGGIGLSASGNLDVSRANPDVRAGARQRAGHRRPGGGRPDRGRALGGHAARPRGPVRSRGPGGGGGGGRPGDAWHGFGRFPAYRRNRGRPGGARQRLTGATGSPTGGSQVPAVGAGPVSYSKAAYRPGRLEPPCRSRRRRRSGWTASWSTGPTRTSTSSTPRCTTAGVSSRACGRTRPSAVRRSSGSPSTSSGCSGRRTST